MALIVVALSAGVALAVGTAVIVSRLEIVHPHQIVQTARPCSTANARRCPSESAKPLRWGSIDRLH